MKTLHIKDKTAKLNKEEKYVLKLQKEEEKQKRKQERELKKQEKLALKLEKQNKVKSEPTESELVHKYVNRIIKNQQYHGRIDTDKFQGLEYEKTVSKNLWLDTNFYFSVVFQSTRQKMEFLEKWEAFSDKLVGESMSSISKLQIINGLKLAKALNIELQEETTRPYPTGNIDLMPFCLDDQNIENK